MNEIKRFDEEGNITKEWSEYVKNLDREDLETFFIGADAAYRRLEADYAQANDIIVEQSKELEELKKGDPKSN